MRRGWGVAAIAASFLVGVLLSHGCVDNRAKVRTDVFLCNASSPSADSDCGAGFTCYGAAQAIGSAICVPRCDPANPRSCPGAGVCTLAGACLTRCTVPAAGASNPCPSPLSCRRITDAPLERAMGPDGVCLPLNLICNSSADCTSSIFDGCTSEVTGATQGPGLLTSGELCVQNHCARDGIACEPGSACIKDIIPPAIPAPDVCSPVCGSVRSRRPGSAAFNECLPGLTCLSDSFPSTSAGACAPGFPGWLCVDSVGCTAGACNDWGDVDPAMAAFLTCSPRCKTDADCVPFDRGVNPSVITHFTCHHTPDGDSWCRNLSSLFFPLTCLHGSDRCQLEEDPSLAKCVTAPPAVIPDGGLVVCGGVIDTGAMGLGALGGSAPSCQHPCTTRDDCAKLSAAAHVPMRCEPSPNGGAFCAPVVPFITHCDPAGNDADCFGGLHCLNVAPPSAPPHFTCTLPCASSDDCAKNDALGTTFACIPSGICAPKTESGCTGGGADFCISGRALPGGKCVSPKDWACNLDAQCESGKCLVFPGTTPPFGRCM